MGATNMTETAEGLPSYEQKQKENTEIVDRITKKLWAELFEATDAFNDARRYVIFSRVTGFMVANVYLPIVSRAVNDVLDTGSTQSEGEK